MREATTPESFAAIGVAASVITLIVLKTMENAPLHGILTAAVGILSCVIVGYFASLCFSTSERELEGLTFSTLKKVESQS